MNSYVTGKMIKKIREEKHMTQVDLANQLMVSEKTISKWETGRGYPDISLIEPLALALGVSVIELMSGENVVNTNKSANLFKSKIYVCPVCGNVIRTIGNACISCCGISLFEEEANNDEEGIINVEIIENEYYVSINHPMNKQHHISFIGYITNDKFDFVKLYPESNAEVRFKRNGHGFIVCYCNKHGLIKISV